MSSKRVRLFAFVLCVLLPVSIVVGDESKASDREESTASEEQALRTSLLNDLRGAESELEGSTAESALWEYWVGQAPTPETRALLDEGQARRDAYDFAAAEEFFHQLVTLAPEYAEGYNQRAFARFLREKYAQAQADLEKTLELEPAHFGALSGLYHIYAKQGSFDKAFEYLRQAVEIHPWLKERSALPKDKWPLQYRMLHDKKTDI